MLEPTGNSLPNFHSRPPTELGIMPTSYLTCLHTCLPAVDSIFGILDHKQMSLLYLPIIVPWRARVVLPDSLTLTSLSLGTSIHQASLDLEFWPPDDDGSPLVKGSFLPGHPHPIRHSQASCGDLSPHNLLSSLFRVLLWQSSLFQLDCFRDSWEAAIQGVERAHAPRESEPWSGNQFSIPETHHSLSKRELL